MKTSSNILLLAAIALMALSTAACKRCVTCSYETGGGNIVNEEFCSRNRDERVKFADQKAQEAENAGAEVHCVPTGYFSQ